MRSIIVMVLGAALLVPDAAFACHRRSSCHGGGCYGGYAGGGCYGSGSGYHGGWSGCHGGYSGCYGSGHYGSGGYHAWGGGYYSNGYASNSYVYPGATYTPSNETSSPRTSSYFEANPAFNTNGVINGTSRQARVEVILPDANAELLIQDQKTNTVGARRSFVSPDLETGKTFTYTLKMQRNVGGQMQDETRSIDVQAGSVMTVDFTKPKSESFKAPDGFKSNQPPIPEGSRLDKAPNPDSSSRPASPPK